MEGEEDEDISLRRKFHCVVPVSGMGAWCGEVNLLTAEGQRENGSGLTPNHLIGLKLDEWVQPPVTT